MSRRARGAVETLRIDGRPAWGWFGRQASSRTYVAAVAHADETHSVEVRSSLRGWLDEDLMRRTARRFAREPCRRARGEWS